MVYSAYYLQAPAAITKGWVMEYFMWQGLSRCAGYFPFTCCQDYVDHNGRYRSNRAT